MRELLGVLVSAGRPGESPPERKEAGERRGGASRAKSQRTENAARQRDGRRPSPGT